MARAKTPGNGSTSRKRLQPCLRRNRLKSRKATSPRDLEEEIRVRAYQLYEERGYTPGHENEDWLVAEREVLAVGDNQQSA